MRIFEMLISVEVMWMALTGGLFWIFTFFTWLFDEKFDREPTGFECLVIYFIAIGIMFAVATSVLNFGGFL